jgi:MFS family permease
MAVKSASRRPPRPLASRLGVLSERKFRLFFIGYMTSLTGAAMVPVALTFAVLDQGRGTVDVGYVLAAETIPFVALLLIGGAVADRFTRKGSMLSADIARFVSEGVLAILLLTGSPPLWAFLLLAGVLGVGQAFFNPAMTGLTPELVSPGSLQQANALRGVASSAGQVLGPSLAGVIVAAGGPGWAIAIDSLTYAVSAICLLRLDIPPQARPEATSMPAQLLQGWHEFRARTWLWLIVTQFATFNAFSFAPFIVLGAVIAHQHLGGAGPWGEILAVFGAGSIVGGLTATRLRSGRPLVTATLCAATFALPLTLLAIPASTIYIALAAGAAGIGLSVFDTLWETTLQREVPAAALSRVSSYDWFGSVAFVPCGYILAGPLSAVLGIRVMLLLGAGWVIVSCGAVLTSRSVRGLTPPARQSAEQRAADPVLRA